MCLCGFVRTLSTPRVFNSLARGFHSQGFEHVDLFGVVSSRGDDTAKGQWRDVSAAELAPAVAALPLVSWVDDSVPEGAGGQSPDDTWQQPRCGLMCMRQFDRFERCRRLIEHREAQCHRIPTQGA